MAEQELRQHVKRQSTSQNDWYGSVDLENPLPNNNDYQPLPGVQQNQIYEEIKKGKNIFKLTEVEPVYNNQSTTLMICFSKTTNLLLVAHETRIFYFLPYINKHNNKDIRETAEGLISKIIAMFTTRKYRFIWSFYLLSHYLDKTILVLLVTSLFIPIQEGNKYWDILGEYWSIFFVLAIEIFLNVLEYNIKVWLLIRLSIYLHLILYVGYALSFAYEFTDVEPSKIKFVIILYLIRFFAFILGQFIDFAIDLEVDYDLMDTNGEGKIHKLFIIDTFINSFKNLCGYCVINKNNQKFEDPGRGYEATIELENWEYKGSIFVWTCMNVLMYKPNEKHECKYRCPKCCENWHRIIFYVMFIIIYGIVALPIMIVVFVCVGLLTFFRKIALKCCCCMFNSNDNIYKSSICAEIIGQHGEHTY